MKYQIELETNDFIPQADMSNTPGLIEFLKAMLPNEISAFRITKEGAAEMGEFEMTGDVIHLWPGMHYGSAAKPQA